MNRDYEKKSLIKLSSALANPWVGLDTVVPGMLGRLTGGGSIKGGGMGRWGGKFGIMDGGGIPMDGIDFGSGKMEVCPIPGRTERTCWWEGEGRGGKSRGKIHTQEVQASLHSFLSTQQILQGKVQGITCVVSKSFCTANTFSTGTLTLQTLELGLRSASKLRLYN